MSLSNLSKGQLKNRCIAPYPLVKTKKQKTKVGPCCNARPYRPKINPDRNVKKGHDDDGNGNELIHSGQEASLNNVVQLCCGIIK